MSVINTIRKHSGVLAGIIAVGLLLLIIGGDIVQLTSILSGRHRTDVGEVGGQKITLTEYQAQVERLRRWYPTGTSREEGHIREQAWRQIVTPIIYRQECSMLGLATSNDELVDMVQGDHIHPELQAAFKDAKTQQFDKQQLVAYLQKVAQMPEVQQVQWRQFESNLIASRQHEKLLQLMLQSAFLSALEARAQHNRSRVTRHIRYLYIPYYTYADEAIQITDTMLKDYLKTHKDVYQMEEHREIRYVTFPIMPSKEDALAFQEELRTLKQDFVQAEDARVFASTNTDGDPSLSYLRCTLQKLPYALVKQASRLKAGLVVGPLQEGNQYRLYKVVSVDNQSDQEYTVAIIEKQLVPGDHSRDQLFKRADHCANTIRDIAQLEAYATQESLPLHKAQVKKDAVRVGTLQARELVRWLYNEATVGQASPVFEVEDGYVVAIMTERIPAGTAPLRQVRDKIVLEVSNQCKARAIVEKLRKAGNTTLEGKMAYYGEGARLLECERLRLEEDTLPGAGMARKTVGTSFALEPDEQATVADDNGVLVVEIIGQPDAQILEDTTAHQEKMRELLKPTQPYDVLQALESLVNIKDYRHKFY